MAKLSPLASVAATREVLERYGLATKKALGQHFLINDGIVARICDLAELSPKDAVLEVGPGIGTLTLGLLAKAGVVVAVERDKDLPLVLAETCSAYRNSFALISQDALALTEKELLQALSALPASSATETAEGFPQKFVSNLPYAVAATLVLDFFERFPWLQSATVMVQSEVADRMCARPGTKAYGAYTVKLNLYASVQGRFTVSPQNFFPPPHVDSAVLRLNRRELREVTGKAVAAEVLRATALMADASFANRRKTILNSCRTYFEARDEESAFVKEKLLLLFEQAKVAPNLRGEVLDLDDYLRLGQAYLNLKFQQNT